MQKYLSVITELGYYSRIYRIRENPSKGPGNALLAFLKLHQEGAERWLVMIKDAIYMHTTHSIFLPFARDTF